MPAQDRETEYIGGDGGAAPIPPVPPFERLKRLWSILAVDAAACPRMDRTCVTRALGGLPRDLVRGEGWRQVLRAEALGGGPPEEIRYLVRAQPVGLTDKLCHTKPLGSR